MKIKHLRAMALMIALVQSSFAYQKDKSMIQAFFSAVTQGNELVVKEMLSADPSLARAKDENGVTAVLKATYFGRNSMVELLLATHPDLNIFEAAATGKTERVRELLTQDLTLVKAFSPDGFTPLGLAVFFGHRDSVEVLLASGADVNVPSRESMKVTPLQSAAAGRRLEIARLLIVHGANVNASQTEGGFTALHEAAANGDIEFAKLLLQNGASINAKMSDGKTPLGFAIERKQAAMADFLRSRGGLN